MYTYYLRRFSVILLLVVSATLVWFNFSWRPVAAQQAPFLGSPYYGAKANNAINSYFDHQYPTYSCPPNGVTTNTNCNTAIANAFPNVTIYTGAQTASCNPYCYDGHDGIDFNMIYEPVISAARGTVIKAEWDSSTNRLYNYGLVVEIRHDSASGYITRYGHLSAVAVTPGQIVEAGQIIGTSGSTGNSSGPHLHFGIRNSANQTVDPFGWTGNYTDPWQQYSGATSICLWKDGEWANTAGCGGVSQPIPAPIDAGQPLVVNITANNTAGFSKGTGGHFVTPCTNNCGGWTQNSTTYSGAVNGTTENKWARWIPGGIPSDGAIYEVWVHVPNANATSWQAPFKITTAAGATLASTIIDQAGLNNQDVSIGTYTLNPGDYVYTVDATGENATTGHVLGADTVRFVRLSTKVYAPDVRFNNGWSSTVILANNGGGLSRVILKFLDSNGNQVCTTLQTVLVGRGSQGYTCGGTQLASVVVDSSQDLSTVVVHQISSGSTYGTEAYPGVDHPAAEVHIPIVQKQNGTWNSKIFIQNSGSSATNVTVEFFPSKDANGLLIGNYGIFALAGSLGAGATAQLNVDSSNGTLNSIGNATGKFIGAMRITNSQNQLLAVASTQYSANQLMETSNTQPPATVVYAPLIQNNNSGWLTGSALRRTSGGGNFTIQYYNNGNGSGCYSPPAANGNPDPRNDYPVIPIATPPAVSPCPKTPTAIFQAGSTMAANVNQLSNTTGATTYAAISQPAFTAIVPKAYNSGGWSDGLTIMNTSSANATITVRLYKADGTLDSTPVNNSVVVARQSIVVYPLPVGFIGSAVVTSSQLIAVSANSFNSGNGGDNIGSYPAIHR